MQDGPKAGSKPGPSPAEVKAKRDEKRNAAVTVGGFYSHCLSAGVQAVSFERGEHGSHLYLRGTINGKKAQAGKWIADGAPFELSIVACLEAWKRGVQEYQDDHPPPEKFQAVIADVPADFALGEPDVESVAQAVEAYAKAEGGAKLQAAMDRSASVSTSIRKASTAKAGTRPKIAGKICKREGCPQPVSHPGSEFCGGSCAQKWHIQDAARRQGVKLP